MVASINIRLRAKSAIANGIEKRLSVDVASFRGGVKIQTIDLASKALLLILRKRECRSVVADVFIAQTRGMKFQEIMTNLHAEDVRKRNVLSLDDCFEGNVLAVLATGVVPETNSIKMQLGGKQTRVNR